MKLISYVGIEESTIFIEKATDLYPALDYIQTKMVELSEEGEPNTSECADFISTLMKQAEESGFGNYEDVDNIEYS